MEQTESPVVWRRYRASEITPREVFENAPRVHRAMAVGAATGGALWRNGEAFARCVRPMPRRQKLAAKPNPAGSSSSTRRRRSRTSRRATTTTTSSAPTRRDPAQKRAFAEDPTRGRCRSKARSRSRRRYDIDEILKLAPLEERVYRLRCVEGWSMVIPWIGYLAVGADQEGRADRQREIRRNSSRWPTRRRCRACRQPVLDWPYFEGLRMDEAMHPLTLLTVGHVWRKCCRTRTARRCA